jgi:16S rRNA (guanine1207-N2)-methyltransferase
VEGISEILLRNAADLRGESILLINPPRDGLHSELAVLADTLTVSSQDHGDFRWLLRNGATASFDLLPPALPGIDHVILRLPREKDRLDMMLHGLSSRMDPSARLWLSGENRAGIKSAAKHLERHFRAVRKLDSARHCRLYEASQPRHGEAFALEDYLKYWEFDFAGNTVQVSSLPGVFAHGRLDEGTAMLLGVLEEIQPAGRILDFACGSGAVGASLLMAVRDAELTMLDTFAPALESTRRTLAANGVGATVLASDGLAELTGSFDWIVSNPPFHQGIRNELDTTHRFFSGAANFLRPEGRILIVCNRHLPYPKWLAERFGTVETLSADRRYTVIQAGHGTPRRGQ